MKLHCNYKHSKVITRNCNVFAKLIPINFRLKCIAFVHENLGSILDSFTSSTLKFIVYSCKVKKMHSKRI